MAKIKSIKGRQVFDSRGNPTVEAEIILEDGHHASAIVPSGASTGTHEAYELRDGDNSRYFGFGTLKAVEQVKGLSSHLTGIESDDQNKIDTLLFLTPRAFSQFLAAFSTFGTAIAQSSKVYRVQKDEIVGNLNIANRFV